MMSHFDHSMNVSEVFLVFATYTTLVILKMMMMSFITAFYRGLRGAFENPEDIADTRREEKYRQMKTHPDVERMRRCHQNDLENIIPFVLIGLMYCLTAPDVASAEIHFRIFAAARVCHTVAYVCPLPQPSRVLTWLVGVLVTFSMAYRVLTMTFHL